MKSVETTVRDFELTDEDKLLMCQAYDLAWAMRQELFCYYYDNWKLNREKLINDTDAVMKAIADLMRNFLTDEEFADLGRDEK